jgi:hypothetical protein
MNKDARERLQQLDGTETGDLIDQAGTLKILLNEALLVSDEEATWHGQPARLLVIRPGLLVNEAQIWLDASGSPMAWSACSSRTEAQRARGMM